MNLVAVDVSRSRGMAETKLRLNDLPRGRRRWLAGRIGVGYAWVCAILQGKRRPSLDVMDGISEVLEFPTVWWLEPYGGPQSIDEIDVIPDYRAGPGRGHVGESAAPPVLTLVQQPQPADEATRGVQRDAARETATRAMKVARQARERRQKLSSSEEPPASSKPSPRSTNKTRPARPSPSK